MSSVQPASSNKSLINLSKTVTFGVVCFLGYKCYQSFTNSTDKQLKKEEEEEEKRNVAEVALPSNIDEMFEVALAAALEAGELVSEFITDSAIKQNAMKLKSNHADLCTVIDKKCEELILNKHILKHFPEHEIIAEESCENSNSFTITDSPTWFIDPIDGTTNFVHNLYICGICIGLRINKQAVLGVVHFPILNETYYAIKNRGAFMFKNGDRSTTQQIWCNKNGEFDGAVTDLRSCMIVCEAGYDRESKWCDLFCAQIKKLMLGEKIRGLRVYGSAAFNMITIASGKCDIYFEGLNNFIGPKPWDFTAPEVIVCEAGGYVCLPENVNEQPFDCTKGRVLCCRSQSMAQYIQNKVNLYPKDVQY